MTKPLLIISDSPSATSGLGRITRDLATRIHANMQDVFKVGTLGYGGPGSTKFPWPDYHMHSIEGWLVPELPLVVDDFAGQEEPILMFIWDLSRLAWFADPRQCPMPHLRKFLETKKFKKWLYHPIDAEGPNGRLSVKLAATMKGFDRVLDYSAFSCGVTGNKEHLPHGIDTSVFRPHNRKWAKQEFRKAGFMGLKDDSFLVGIVATNQARKDYALGIQTCKILLDRGLDVRVWIHCDTLERYWDLGALLVDYELQGRVVITTSNFTDEQMSVWYSACNVTLGIGSEGYGYPLAESTASGTPVVTGEYAGGAEVVPCWMTVEPISYRSEGLYCCKRPVFDAKEWALTAIEQGTDQQAVELLPELDWNNLWPRWEKWLREGAQ